MSIGAKTEKMQFFITAGVTKEVKRNYE